MTEKTIEFTCETCDVVLPRASLFETEQGLTCTDCIKAHFRICEYSFNMRRGEVVLDHEDHFTHAYWTQRNVKTEGWVHEDVVDDRFRYTYNDEWWHKDDTYSTTNHGYISVEDYNHGSWFTCETCDEIHHTDDQRECGACDEFMCRYCYREHDCEYSSFNMNESCCIHPYNYRPETYFFMLPSEPRDTQVFYGCEIEIDGRNNVGQANRVAVANFFDDNMKYEDYPITYNKEDGSLTNYGFEAVTHPMTLAFITENKQLFKKAFDFALANHFRAHQTETCGLHIHVSKKAFKNERAVDNFVFLFERFYEQILTFSRRSRYNYERWADRYGVYNDDDTNRSFADKLATASREKYRIVNLLHRHTLEVRAFRGTLNVDTFLASVQFMDVMRQLANLKDIAVNNLSWQTVVKLAKVSNFTELNDYMTQRNLHRLQTPRRKFKPLPTKQIVLGQSLVVIGNNSHNRHYYELGSIVRVVGQDSRRFIVKFESHPTSKSLSFDTQNMLHTDLATLDDPTPLSQYDVEFVETTL